MSTTEKSTSGYRHYIYKGEVYSSFDKVIETNWYGETMAPTKRKALSNLKFQFCKERGLHPYSHIHFDSYSLICKEEVRDVDFLLPQLLAKKEEPTCQQLTLTLL